MVYILQVADDKYLTWSTSYGSPIDKIKSYEEYKQSIHELYDDGKDPFFKSVLFAKLERARVHCASRTTDRFKADERMKKKSLKERKENVEDIIFEDNRAGDNEKSISLTAIVKKYS